MSEVKDDKIMFSYLPHRRKANKTEFVVLQFFRFNLQTVKVTCRIPGYLKPDRGVTSIYCLLSS